jgi:glycosyltransferase involved in cell wall biosynthesis
MIADFLKGHNILENLEQAFELVISEKLSVEEAKRILVETPDTLIDCVQSTDWWLWVLLKMLKYGEFKLKQDENALLMYYFGEKAMDRFDGMRVFHLSKNAKAIDEHKGIVSIYGYYSDFGDEYTSAVSVNGTLFPEQIIKIRPQIRYAGEDFFIIKTVKYEIDLNCLFENATEPLEMSFVKNFCGELYAWERIDVPTIFLEKFSYPTIVHKTLIQICLDENTIKASKNPNYFPYQVSVIVPIYNAAQYLRECLDSILMQKTTHDFEILLIDDKSNDNSRQILAEFGLIDTNIKILEGDGLGIGAARNIGLRAAEGKYVMFVNADDFISDTALDRCANFFEKQHTQIDIITYPEYRFNSDRDLGDGKYRYDKLKTNVYDVLTDSVYLSCLGVNIMIKNRSDVFFRENIKDVYEDVEFCADIIKKKYRLGFVKEAIYHRRTDNYYAVTANDSAVSTFELSLACFERILTSSAGDINYFSATVLTLLEQKLLQNSWLPYHYKYENIVDHFDKFEDAINRAKHLVSFIDVNVILNHPDVPPLHKAYWISFANKALIAFSPMMSQVVVNHTVVLTERKIQIAMSKFYREDELLTSFFMLRSVLLNYTQEIPEVIVVETDYEGNETRRNLSLTFSLESWFRNSQTQTNNFLSFRYSVNTCETKSFYFKVRFKSADYEYDTFFYAYESSGFANRKGASRSVICGDTLIKLYENVFHLKKLDEPLEYPLAGLLVGDSASLRSVIAKGRRLKQERRIWLYTDMFQAERDNARFQFEHDFYRNDGIEKYYIVTHDSDVYHFDEAMHPFLIHFNSMVHRIMFCAAEKVFSSFCGSIDTYTPFNKFETDYVIRAVFPEIIYLQHGILHARMKSYNNMRRNYDKVVISSHFERENFPKTYDIPEELLLPFGMARFDMMDKNVSPRKKILFAPSWRSNLAINKFGEQRQLVEGKLLSSEYWRKIDEFLSNEQLASTLKNTGWELEVKLHPIIENASDLIADKYPNIRFIKEDGEFLREDYKIFITDFSSFTFDFVYLERAIMYFVPDYEIWRSGKYHYNTLDIEYDQAFGNLTRTPEDAVRALCHLIERNGEPEPLFLERMQTFFLHDGGNNRKMLYDEMIKEGGQDRCDKS